MLSIETHTLGIPLGCGHQAKLENQTETGKLNKEPAEEAETLSLRDSHTLGMKSSKLPRIFFFAPPHGFFEPILFQIAL